MIHISKLLERNIRMAREDSEFLACKKLSVADALYGLSVAKEQVDDEELKKLIDTANDVIMSYMFHLQLFLKKD